MIAVYYFIGILSVASAATGPKYIFYHSSTSDSYQLAEAVKILDNPNFINSIHSTVIYFHGHNESSDSDTVKAIIRAYIENGGYNILIFDWRELAARFYPLSVAGLDELGNEVAKSILKMIERQYPISKIRLVGHSLGAQLCGYIGMYIISLSNNTLTIPRISGLDPAFPGFYILTLGNKAISAKDALFVDIIHTDSGRYGAPVNTGTVDFYANGGRRPQPGCETGLCSHQRSVYLWAESVSSKEKNSFKSNRNGKDKLRIQMGNNCPVNAPPGAYLVDTNSETPFSRN